MSHHSQGETARPLAPGRYLAVWAALMALTALTWGLSTFHIPGAAGVAVALTIASVKGALVALFFMHLYDQTGPNRLVLLTSLVFVALLVLLTLLDNATRFPLANPPDAETAPQRIATPSSTEPSPSACPLRADDLPRQGQGLRPACARRKQCTRNAPTGTSHADLGSGTRLAWTADPDAPRTILLVDGDPAAGAALRAALAELGLDAVEADSCAAGPWRSSRPSSRRWCCSDASLPGCQGDRAGGPPPGAWQRRRPGAGGRPGAAGGGGGGPPAGADAFLVRPLEATHAAVILQRAAENRRLRLEGRASCASRSAGGWPWWGRPPSSPRSSTWRGGWRRPRPPVLVVGEAGAGKQHLAQALHELSPRRVRPFLASTAPPWARRCSTASSSAPSRGPSRRPSAPRRRVRARPRRHPLPRRGGAPPALGAGQGAAGAAGRDPGAGRRP